MEEILITVSITKKGVAWEKTCIDKFVIQAEQADAYKAVAQEIIKLDPLPFENGLYVRAVNRRDEVESYLLVPTEENGKRSFFVRSGYGRDGWNEDYEDSEEMMRYLVCLDEDTNDYKSYTMYHEAYNDKFGVTYGRIGGTDLLDRSKYNFDKEGMHFYPNKMFWIKYYEKIMKGYVDKTEEMDFEYSDNAAKSCVAEKHPDVSDYSPIDEEETKRLIEMFIETQRGYVNQNYNYYSGKELHTQLNAKAIEKSEWLLDNMTDTLNALHREWEHGHFGDYGYWLIKEFWRYYKELLMTLPRKVGNVKEYIERVVFEPSERDNDNYAEKVLEQERDLLQALKDVIEIDTQQALPSPVETEKKETVLEHYGLSAQTADYEDKFDVLEKMGAKAYSASCVLAVRNNKTHEAYEKCCKELGIQKRGCHLLWHGSRTENWWSIFKNGMSLNPNAITTGKMFGQGLYFAPKAEKSMGYVDMSGSYWAHGTKRTGYLALFEVAMGKPYTVHNSLNYDFRFEDLRNGCHSTWAKAGSSLRNDECIVYKEEQCDIRYLVEVDYNRQKDYSIDIKKARNLCIDKPCYTQVNGNTHIVSFAVPNFQTCTGISAKGVTGEYNIDNDTLELSRSGSLNSTDLEFIKDVIKSNFAENEREFKELCVEITDSGKIPERIYNRLKTLKKDRPERPKDYVSRY